MIYIHVVNTLTLRYGESQPNRAARDSRQLCCPAQPARATVLRCAWTARVRCDVGPPRRVTSFLDGPGQGGLDTQPDDVAPLRGSIPHRLSACAACCYICDIGSDWTLKLEMLWLRFRTRAVVSLCPPELSPYSRITVLITQKNYLSLSTSRDKDSSADNNAQHVCGDGQDLPRNKHNEARTREDGQG